MKYIIAHDFGTSSVKASLFCIDGTLVASSTISYTTYHEYPTYAEQDAEDWWNAFCENNRILLSKAEDPEVLCVSFSSAFPNCLLVDEQIKPLHRAMIWQDTRATRQADEISKKLPKVYTARAPGGKISPDRSLPKLLWIKENQPDVYAKAYKMLPSAASYIILKLTGIAACDYPVAYGTSMIQRGTKCWADDVLEIAGVPASLMPELHERTDAIGAITPAAAAECGLSVDTKVICGTVDSDCSTLGGGLLKPGDALLLGGTSAEIDALDLEGRKIGRPTSSSGASMKWLCNTIGCVEKALAEKNGTDPYSLVCERIADVPAGSGGVMFLPYLAGERGVRNDPWARGTFTGISLSTTREDLMRAVIEGIGFNLNLMLDQIREAGVDVKTLPVVGGLGKSDSICQIFADIMGVTVVTFEHMDEAAVVGAAVIAGIGIGLYQDTSVVSQFMRPAKTYEPNADNHKKYLELMPYFDQIYRDLQSTYQKMNAVD